MRLLGLFCAGCLLALRPPLCLGADPPKPAAFELRDGDRVVLLGNTFIERDQVDCYIETALTRLFPNKDFSFRNLGWSGDTVDAIARSYFGPPEEGFQRLVESVERIDPTLVMISYGQNAAFEGEAGLPRFKEGLERLVDKLAKPGRRWVFLSPTFHEDMGDVFPDPTDYNRDLLLYQQALADCARQKGGTYFDITAPSNGWDTSSTSPPLTRNTIHFDDYGYWRMAQVVTDRLGIPEEPWQISIDLETFSLTVRGTELKNLERTDDQGVAITLLDSALPVPPTPKAFSIGRQEPLGTGRTMRIGGLSEGAYRLVIDGAPVLISVHGVRQATAEAKDWQVGIGVTSSPEFDQVEKLRALIKEKNTLYFDRWRPQNETYLFGFRKHEQGQNAVEIPQFEPLVAERDQQIEALKVPVPHRYEIRPAGAAR